MGSLTLSSIRLYYKMINFRESTIATFMHIDSHDTVFDDNKTLKSCLKINRNTDQSDFGCIKLAVDSLQTILCS